MKILKRTATVLCGVFSLYWVAVISLMFDYALTSNKIFDVIFAMFIMAIIASAFLSNIVAFKKYPSKSLKIAAVVLLCAIATLFLVIPDQVFILPRFVLFSYLGEGKIVLILSYFFSKWLSVAISVITAVLLATPSKKEKTYEN